MSYSSRPLPTPSSLSTPSTSKRRPPATTSALNPTSNEDDWEDVSGGEEDEAELDPDAEVGSAPLGIPEQEWAKINKNERLKKEAFGKLLDQFDATQRDRYENYRRSALRKEGVKKVAGFVLGANVSPQVVLALRSVGKVFVGEIIEKAKDYQESKGENGPLRPNDLREAYRFYLEEHESKAGGSTRGKRAMFTQ